MRSKEERLRGSSSSAAPGLGLGLGIGLGLGLGLETLTLAPILTLVQPTPRLPATRGALYGHRRAGAARARVAGLQQALPPQPHTLPPEALHLHGAARLVRARGRGRRRGRGRVRVGALRAARTSPYPYPYPYP